MVIHLMFRSFVRVLMISEFERTFEAFNESMSQSLKVCLTWMI